MAKTLVQARVFWTAFRGERFYHTNVMMGSLHVFKVRDRPNESAVQVEVLEWAQRMGKVEIMEWHYENAKK